MVVLGAEEGSLGVANIGLGGNLRVREVVESDPDEDFEEDPEFEVSRPTGFGLLEVGWRRRRAGATLRRRDRGGMRRTGRPPGAV